MYSERVAGLSELFVYVILLRAIPNAPRDFPDVQDPQ